MSPCPPRKTSQDAPWVRKTQEDAEEKEGDSALRLPTIILASLSGLNVKYHQSALDEKRCKRTCWKK